MKRRNDHEFEVTRLQHDPAPSSALIWLPAICAAGLPVPRTEIVPLNPSDLYPTLDGLALRPGFPFESLEAACERIGYPVFLRTDLSSAKHRGREAWKVESRTDIICSALLTFEDNFLKDIGSACRAWLIREFLPLRSDFEAFNGLPIGREWRLFADQDGAQCSHYYWPATAFRQEMDLPEDWKERLAALSIEPPELAQLKDMATEAARAVGAHAWSVDFAQDVTGKWWLLDMARAEQSWHPVSLGCRWIVSSPTDTCPKSDR